MADVRSQRNIGQARGHRDPTANLGQLQIVLNEVTGVSHKVVQGVVLWIHRPNDFTQRLRQRPCFVSDPADVRLDRILGTFGVLSQFTENDNLRQPGPQIIMDVIGNASPLHFNGPFPLDAVNPAV